MQYEALDQWQFIIAAYAIGLGGTIVLVVQSWLAMRKAEARRDNVRNNHARNGHALQTDTRQHGERAG